MTLPAEPFTSFFAGTQTNAVEGPVVASAATISPTSFCQHVSGTTQINTINLPYAGFHGSIVLIPDGLWSTGTSGNIALATTAVVGKAVVMTYTPSTGKWYPSY